MNAGIEIYVRPSGNRVLLNLYVPEGCLPDLKAALLAGHNANDLPIALELTVLPEWLTGNGEGHVRIPISEINVIATDA